MSIRIPHVAITRAPGLLPMQYTLVELAIELGLSARTLREWVSNTDLAVPHLRDTRGHIWIEGRAFALWLESQRAIQSKPKHQLKPGEAYCVSCRAVVQPKNLHPHQTKKRIVLRGTCPVCNHQVNRVVSWRTTSTQEAEVVV